MDLLFVSREFDKFSGDGAEDDPATPVKRCEAL